MGESVRNCVLAIVKNGKKHQLILISKVIIFYLKCIAHGVYSQRLLNPVTFSMKIHWFIMWVMNSVMLIISRWAYVYVLWWSPESSLSVDVFRRVVMWLLW